MADLPEEVLQLRNTLQSLSGVRDVDIGVHHLTGLSERDLSLPGEFGDFPHLVIRRSKSSVKNEVLVAVEVWMTQDYQGWIALEFLAWWVRDQSRGGEQVQMCPLALPPVAYGTQLGRTLKFVIEFFCLDRGENSGPVLKKLTEFTESLEYSLENYAEALARPTQADTADLVALRRCANNEDASAQFHLAQCYAQGEGVKKHKTHAFRWYERAASHGHPEALMYLGLCNAKGEGTLADPAKALDCYRKAAEAGLPLAMGLVGQCYEEGRAVPKDEVEAVRWYRLSADGGEVSCLAQLGECYEFGRGVKRNMRKALECYRQANEEGFDAVRPVIERVEAALG
jgi:hypothetical protein